MLPAMLGLGLRPGSVRMGRKKQLAHGSLVCLCCLLICEGGVDQVAMRIFYMKVLWVSRKPACRVTEHFVEGTGVHMALLPLLLELQVPWSLSPFEDQATEGLKPGALLYTRGAERLLRKS